MNNATPDDLSIAPFPDMTFAGSDVQAFDFTEHEKRVAQALGLSPAMLSSDIPFTAATMGAMQHSLRESMSRPYQAAFAKSLDKFFGRTERRQNPFRVIRSASARKRKTQRKTLVTFSPGTWLKFSLPKDRLSTGRLNQGMPIVRYDFAKPRTKVGDLVLDLKSKGFFRD